MSEPNQEIKGGRYVLLRRLGEGSQGETWEALDRGPDYKRATSEERDLAAEWQRYVNASRGAAPPPSLPGGVCAVKCFRVGRAKAWKDVELAEREARTLAALAHPKLPRYLEHFEEDGSLYLVMEKIEGESLAAMRARHKTLGPAEIIRLLEDCADALAYLRGQSAVIVHRDIKPGNVIRRPDGSFVIVDFGSVRDRLKPAGGSTVVGTFGYMAPEQFQGRASPRSDVYGVAATALTMLTGVEPEDLPHEGLRINVARAVPHGTPHGLVRALTAMLVDDPDKRAGSIEEALAPARRSAPPMLSQSPTAKSAFSSPRKARKAKRRADREERKRRRRERGRRLWPFLPTLLAHVGLFIAWIVVWVTVGLVTPLALGLLSLLFGAGLRRAATACVRAAGRSQQAIGQASAWIRGYRKETLAIDDPVIRVGTPMRIAAEEERAEEEELAEAPEPARKSART